MLRQILLLLAVIGVAFAVQCYVGQQTLPNRNSAFTQGVNTMGMQLRDCGPNVRMCFKSYVRRNNNGDDSHTETRDCGDVNSGRCFQETGCSGKSSNRICCCAGDLCNSSPKIVVSLGLISIFVARIFCF